MNSNTQSLVAYQTPTLVSTTRDKSNDDLKNASALIEPQRQTTQTEDILNSILPPREWTEDGQLWVQYVSSNPATRLEILALQEATDQQLQQRGARETGICPIREEIYSQVFDELIRQVTINCAERGLLLLRIRDEIQMTIAAYQGLYESSIAFGIRKALLAEQKKAQYAAKIRSLKETKKDLIAQVDELTSKCNLIEKKGAEKRQQDDKKHRDEVQHLQSINLQLKSSLEATLSAPRK